jgi:flagellar biosynthesis protein FliQ
MSAANDMKLVMMFVRLVFTILNGLMKLVLQGLMLIPKLINVLLTFLLKLGSVLKLILESTIKMIGNFIVETSRGLKGLWGK